MKHPPKPFTPEWCELHPGQGQCPDDVVSVPIDNGWYAVNYYQHYYFTY